MVRDILVFYKNTFIFIALAEIFQDLKSSNKKN